MSKNLSKYLYQDMDKEAGIQHTFHKTKIVATVGPACDTYDKLLELVKAGVNVFRLNFSHGDHEGKAKIIQHIRNINVTEPYNISILADLQGPKLRVGDIKDGGLTIAPGDILTFTSKEKVVGTKEKIYVSYPNLHHDVVVGNKILIDDGKLEVVVVNVSPDGDVKVAVTYGGVLLPKKGVNLPDTKISLPALTEKDLVDLEFIIEQQCDWVALSFVRKVEDIIDLKRRLAEKKSLSKVIAKIEMPSALDDLRNIVLESDGVMVARGDLGVELPVEKVPMAQRDIIRKCIHRAKPVIVATQMMESMIDRVKPNRSEITDVANAVLEGADAVMLSAETATGQHPPSYLSDAICYNACKLAKDANADALVGMTQSGYTAFILSSYRPKSPLYIFSKEKSLINQLSLSWGVRAFYYAEEESVDGIIHDQHAILKERGFIKQGDVVVNTGSLPIEEHLPTNMLKITKLQ